MALWDLDSTLYQVEPRTLRILREWAAGDEAQSKYLEEAERVTRVTEGEIGYSVKDTFETLGIRIGTSRGHAAYESAKSHWSRRFFTNKYVTHDRPYPGAREFVRALYDEGMTLVYLTGRPASMRKGTLANLLRDGFPFGNERTNLLLKMQGGISDVEHKRKAADFVRTHGALIASFENEPLNLVSLYKEFPEAMHVFVQTRCSDRQAPVAQGLYRLQSFR